MDEDIEAILESSLNVYQYITSNDIKNWDSKKDIIRYVENKLKKTSIDEQECMKIILNNPDSYLFAPNIIRENKDFALYLVLNNYQNIEILPIKMINDREFIIDLITIAGAVMIVIPGMFRNIPRQYYKDKELILTALEIEPSILKYLDDDFRYNVDFIMELIKKDIKFLAYIPLELENVKNIVLNILKENKKAIFYIPDELLYDEDFAFEALKINNSLVSMIYSKFDEKTFFKICIKAGVEVDIPEHLINDKEFILECIWLNSEIFYNQFGISTHFSDELFVQECECLGCGVEKYNENEEELLDLLREDYITSNDDGYTL